MLGRGKGAFSPTTLLFHPVVVPLFLSMESRIFRARLLSPNQIREKVMDSDSDKEKYSASEDTEDDEARPPSRRDVHIT